MERGMIFDDAARASAVENQFLEILLWGIRETEVRITFEAEPPIVVRITQNDASIRTRSCEASYAGFDQGFANSTSLRATANGDRAEAEPAEPPTIY